MIVELTHSIWKGFHPPSRRNSVWTAPFSAGLSLFFRFCPEAPSLGLGCWKTTLQFWFVTALVFRLATIDIVRVYWSAVLISFLGHFSYGTLRYFQEKHSICEGKWGLSLLRKVYYIYLSIERHFRHFLSFYIMVWFGHLNWKLNTLNIRIASECCKWPGLPVCGIGDCGGLTAA